MTERLNNQSYIIKENSNLSDESNTVTKKSLPLNTKPI